MKNKEAKGKERGSEGWLPLFGPNDADNSLDNVVDVGVGARLPAGTVNAQSLGQEKKTEEEQQQEDETSKVNRQTKEEKEVTSKNEGLSTCPR
jgi:hypothetical protein